LHGETIPVYGKSDNIRDWLYVEDHVRGLFTVLTDARVGDSYNVGGDAERTNLDVVTSICRLLDEMLPTSRHRPHERLITFVADRPGPLSLTGRGMTGDMPWTLAKSGPSCYGSHARPSRAACARRFRGISKTAAGGSRSGHAGTKASVWGSAGVAALSSRSYHCLWLSGAQPRILWRRRIRRAR
jgi:hypothetical protein